MWIQIGFSLALAFWLVIIAIADLQRMEVSNWLTLTMVATGVLAACGYSRSLFPLALAILMLILAEIPFPWWSLLPVMISLLVVFPTWEVMIWGWGLAVSLWKSGAIGGADAKVIMALTALIPDKRLLWALVGCWALVDIVRLAICFRGDTFRRLLKGLLKGEGTRVPALPAITAGGLMYLLIAWTSGSAVLPWHFP